MCLRGWLAGGTLRVANPSCVVHRLRRAMPKLIVVSRSSSLASLGGVPVAPKGTQWPTCRTCGAAMQFVAQLPLSAHADAAIATRDQMLLLFQCQNDPGMCDDWDADSGGNAAVLCASEGEPMHGPTGKDAAPAPVCVAFRPYDEVRGGETPDDAYCALLDDDPDVLGKVGGAPLWIQNEETPTCVCGNTMTFFAQIEDRGVGGMNFGDAGAGYAFVCGTCRTHAKFLWQCS